MKKTFGILAVIVAIIFCFPATAFMSRGPSFDGVPDMLDPGHICGTFVWHDSEGFHLRAMTAGGTHVFKGTIHTNGHFRKVTDRFFRGSDYYHFTDRNTIDFQLTTSGRTVGIDFGMADGNYTSFELYMDGHKISPMDIYVGKNGWHPGENKFSLHWEPCYHEGFGEHTVVVVHDDWYRGWHHGWHGYWGYHRW
jgi:hypothetical protein